MLDKNKKGMGNKLVFIIIMAVILVVLILGFFIFQLVGPPLVSTLQDTSSIISTTMSTSNNEVLQNASASSFEPALQSMNNLEWLSYTLFIVMFLTWVIMCFYVRAYPFLIILWIVLMLIMVVLSIYLAVVYQDMRTSPGLAEYYQSWENTDFMLKNLPVVMVVLMVVGGIVMFVLASRDQEAELGVGPGGAYGI